MWILFAIASIAFSMDLDERSILKSPIEVSNLKQNMVSPSSIEKMAYERVVALGVCCVTKTQIKAYFEDNPSVIGGGFIFDWMIPYNTDLLSTCIAQGLTGISNKSFLEVIPAKWIQSTRYTVHNSHYDMCFPHLFEQETKFRPDNTDSDLPLLTPEYLDKNFETIKSKLDHLIKKFIDLKNYPTLYVYAYPGSYTEKGMMTAAGIPNRHSIEKLVKSIELVRGGDKNFTLLFIPAKKEFNDFDNVVVREIYPPEPPKLWIGDTDKWSKVFSEFSYLPPTTKS